MKTPKYKVGDLLEWSIYKRLKVININIYPDDNYTYDFMCYDYNIKGTTFGDTIDKEAKLLE